MRYLKEIYKFFQKTLSKLSLETAFQQTKTCSKQMLKAEVFFNMEARLRFIEFTSFSHSATGASYHAFSICCQRLIVRIRAVVALNSFIKVLLKALYSVQAWVLSRLRSTDFISESIKRKCFESLWCWKVHSVGIMRFAYGHHGVFHDHFVLFCIYCSWISVYTAVWGRLRD